MSAPDLSPVVRAVHAARARVPAQRAVVCAVSGIDASGKGYLAGHLAGRLEDEGLRVAVVGVDPWLNLPDRRFAKENAGEHFYRNALRLEEMFSRLVLPLRRSGSIRLEAKVVEETSADFETRLYAFDHVDVIVLEGIFLFKRAFRRLYDVAVWVECTFETALRRAIDRGQEGLPAEQTIAAYASIYFPAQLVHFERDDPRSAADVTLVNDPRLQAREAAG